MVTGFTAVMELMKIVCKRLVYFGVLCQQRLVYFGVSVPVKTGLLWCFCACEDWFTLVYWFTVVFLCLQRLVYHGVLVYFGVFVPAKTCLLWCTGLFWCFCACKVGFTLVS